MRFSTLPCASACALCLAALALLACEAPAPAAPVCADPALSYVFPSPAWIAADGTVHVPEGELATSEALRVIAPWIDQVEGTAGFPRRPTLVLPLDPAPEAGDTFDAARVHALVRTGTGPWTELEATWTTRIAGGLLVVRPERPLPPDADEVLVVLEAAGTGLRALGACDATGALDAAYLEAEAELPVPVDADLVVRLPIARAEAPLVRLAERVRTDSPLVVTEASTASFADLGELAPTTEVAAALSEPFVRGVLSLPEYRPADHGPMVLGADGAPTAQGTTAPAFVAVLPAAPAAGPYPVVIFQHGGGQSPEEVFRIAGPLARAGFAFVAIDLPEHGNRAAGGAASDLSFLFLDDPIRTRENFRQAVGDHLALVAGLGAIEAEVERLLAVTDPLDETRVFYTGLSLGGITGSITSSVSRDLEASALFVGGGGFGDLLRYGLFSAVAGRLVRSPEPRPSVALAILETIMAGADPLSFALAAEDRSAAPRPLLFFQAMGDPVVGPESNDQWARAFGAVLATPFDHEVSGMRTVALPAEGTFSFAPDAPAATRVLVHCPMAEVGVTARHGELIRLDYTQELVAHCFSTHLETGRCEVIDTGFAAH